MTDTTAPEPGQPQSTEATPLPEQFRKAEQQPATAGAQTPQDAHAPAEPAEPAADADAVPPHTPAPEQPWGPPPIGEPTLDAWSLSAEALQAEQARRPRRTAMLRWGGAAVIAVLTATAAAVAVTTPDRTSLPGLRTPNDGRYAFPQLTLPPLPSGKAEPAKAGLHRHYADLRQLLLPAPAGATLEQPATASAGAAASGSPTAAAPSPAASAAPASPGAPGTPGDGPSATASPTTAAAVPAAAWSDCNDFAATDKNAPKITASLLESACLAATKRVWTGPDGTRTEIWLLRFGSNTEANRFYERAGTKSEPKDAAPLKRSGLVFQSMPTVASQARAADEKADGRPVAEAADIAAGDVVARIVMTNPKGVQEQAFRQVTVLQADLLA
ncbi:hypothetical protein AB0D08_14345 [Kitasatospora sp. NPDC048540]|uniref:hypothetical protein n=1 Tax=unclassified Kitasatospora TaxID=2633591 RepID=UPI00056C3F5F|nr:hypothetical protein [Kitasatospora sp. MBT63]